MNIPKHITSKYLRENPDIVFVFGDNLIHKGKGGAASLRDEPNTYGFITKKYPNNNDSSFYRPSEYFPVFLRELRKLSNEIRGHPEKIYLISKLGSGLANKYHIYEKVIEAGLESLSENLPNIVILDHYI